MGKMMGDFDAQLNIYRMAFTRARSTNDPSDAVSSIRSMWASLPKKIREKVPLTKLKLDNSLYCTIHRNEILWAWCDHNNRRVESAISDHRQEIMDHFEHGG